MISSHHPSMVSRLALTLAVLPLFSALTHAAPATAPAAATRPAGALTVRSATASSTLGEAVPALAIDGNSSDNSRWISQASTAPAWLELDLGTPTSLSGLHVYSGYRGSSVLTDFTVQFFDGNQWVDVPSARISGNTAAALALRFDDTLDVRTSRLRLHITRTEGGYARVAEVFVFPASVRDLPPLRPQAASVPANAPGPTSLIFLNQSGFNAGAPKRFTAPTLADGTAFQILPAAGGGPVFSGVITRNVGDFSAFEPSPDARNAEFVVVAGGQRSVPFRVRQWWLERVTYLNSVLFMIDARHYLGTYTKPCRGSFGWRDDHAFGWELHTLVPQYLSNPSAYDAMPRTVRYEAPTDPTLWGALEPYRDDAPDLVKLIHWGADIIVTQRLTHEHLKAQLAYFLYAWPALEPYLPAQNYKAVRDFAFSVWGNAEADRAYPHDESKGHDLFALQTRIGSTKGGLPPGYSIEPNLMMYEVARRDGLPDADKFLAAAVKQADWIVRNLDWEDPLTTKGQRMSEFLTVCSLSHLLRQYPQHAPAGLREKLDAWARVVVRRSDNLWDFRKLDDADQWCPTGTQRTQWNEPGNVVGLPGAIWAAMPLLSDPQLQRRLDEIAWAHIDNTFGRNPTGRHFSYQAPRDIEGVEFGWYSFHRGGIGRLEDARFVLDGAPKQQHYPFNPEVGDIGWTEGWIQHNVPLNNALAQLAFRETRLTLTREGEDLVVTLKAPLDFDDKKKETARVRLRIGDKEQWLTLTESDTTPGLLTTRLQSEATQATAEYGFGYLSHHATLK